MAQWEDDLESDDVLSNRILRYILCPKISIFYSTVHMYLYFVLVNILIAVKSILSTGTV